MIRDEMVKKDRQIRDCEVKKMKSKKTYGIFERLFIKAISKINFIYFPQWVIYLLCVIVLIFSSIIVTHLLIK